MLREYARGGHTVLLVTHEPDAASFADHLIRMEQGTPAPEDSSVKRFIKLI